MGELELKTEGSKEKSSQMEICSYHETTQVYELTEKDKRVNLLNMVASLKPNFQYVVVSTKK